MNLHIIELSGSDVAVLSELVAFQQETFGSLGLNEGTLPIVIRSGKVFLLKEGEEILGSAELIKDWDDGGCAFLVGFSIKKGHRQKGMGKFFLEGLLNRLQEQISRLRLTVSPHNRPALSLYKQFGFKEIAFCRDEYGIGEDRLLLELEFAGQ